MEGWLADGDALREKIIDGCARRSRFTSTFGRRGSTGRVHSPGGFWRQPELAPQSAMRRNPPSALLVLRSRWTSDWWGAGSHPCATINAIAEGMKNSPPSQARITKSGVSPKDRTARSVRGDPANTAQIAR